MELFEGYEFLDMTGREQRYEQIKTVEVLTEFLTYPIIMDECFRYFCFVVRRIDLLECFLPHIDISTFFDEVTESVYNLWMLGYDGAIDLITFLLDHGLPVDAVNCIGETMLFGACEDDEIVLIDLLIERGANVNHRNVVGETPLFYAVMACDSRVLDRLVANGADIDAVDNKNRNVWGSAIGYGKDEVVKRLIRIKNPKSYEELLEIVGESALADFAPVELEFFKEQYEEAVQ